MRLHEPVEDLADARAGGADLALTPTTAQQHGGILIVAICVANPSCGGQNAHSREHAISER